MDSQPKLIPDQKPLTTVHDALAAAVQETKGNVKLITGTFKIAPEVHEAAQKICKSNGTSLSAYLRFCALSLVNDYRD